MHIKQEWAVEPEGQRAARKIKEQEQAAKGVEAGDDDAMDLEAKEIQVVGAGIREATKTTTLKDGETLAQLRASKRLGDVVADEPPP